MDTGVGSGGQNIWRFSLVAVAILVIATAISGCTDQYEAIEGMDESKGALFGGSASARRWTETWVGEPVDIHVKVCGKELLGGPEGDDTDVDPIEVGGRISVTATATKGAEVQSLSADEKMLLRPGECATWRFVAMTDNDESFDVNFTIATLWGTTDAALDDASMRTEVRVYRTESDLWRSFWTWVFGATALVAAVSGGIPLYDRLEKIRRERGGVKQPEPQDPAVNSATDPSVGPQRDENQEESSRPDNP